MAYYELLKQVKFSQACCDILKKEPGERYAPLYAMGWTDKNGMFHKIKRNGCMGCGTDFLYPNNHMAMLRRTHPKQWMAFMKHGLAAEIQKLRIAMNKGQISIMDVFDADYLLENRPCIFDRIDDVYLDDETWTDEQAEEFDPEVV